MSPSSNMETGKSNATHEEQDGENDQDDTDDTHPAVTEAVTAEAPSDTVILLWWGQSKR
jgi:hypothetical protein